MSTKVLKDSALEGYYQALFEMYGSPGWQKLMEDFTRMHELHNTVAGLDTQEQLWFRKGQISIMEQVLTHQATCEASHHMLLSEQEGEQDAPTGGVAKVIS